MPIPTRSVSGTYTNIDGSPTVGYIEFSPSSVLVSTAVIPVSIKTAYLDETGSFSIELECNDASGVTPVGWLWVVEEKFKNGNTWYLSVPTGDPLNIVDAYVINPPEYPVFGIIGPQGPIGVGVPGGGGTNQILAKASNASYDTVWVTPADAGTGGGTLFYYTTLGAVTAGAYTITHNLGTTDVDVDLYVNDVLSTAGDWTVIDANSVEVVFFGAHDAGEVRVYVTALSGAVGTASAHSELTGLLADDHTQYALADGTRGAFALLSHNHTGVYATVSHNHDTTYLKPTQVVAGSQVVVDTTSIPGSVVISSTASGSTGALDDLSDVAVSGATTGQVLTKGASGWVPTTPATSTSAYFEGYPLDDFAGATDDAKLATAITFISAQTHKSPILLSAGKVYTFNNACPTIYDGFSLIGVGTGGNPEQGSSGGVYGRASMTKVKINYSGTWLNPTTTKWNVRIQNIDFTGTTSTIFANSSTQSAWCWDFVNLGFNVFKSVVGSKTAKCLMTACSFRGWWDVANTSEGGFYIGGSDCKFWHDGMLIDSPPSTAAVLGQYLINLMGLQKTSIGPIYMTVQEGWRGIYAEDLSGSTQGAGCPLMFLPGGVIEGKNDGLSGDGDVGAQGCLIRIKGAYIQMMNWSVNHAMYEPAFDGVTTDLGVIHVSHDGDLYIMQAGYARQTNTAEAVPFIYATGTGTTVNALQIKGTRSGGETSVLWTAKPRYQMASGATISNVDSSMQTV